MSTCITHNKKYDKRNNITSLACFKSFFTVLFVFFAFFILMTIFINNKSYKIYYASADEQVENKLEEELKEQTKDTLDSIDFGELEQLVDDIDVSLNLFDGKSFKEYVLAIIYGEEDINISSFFSLLLSGVKSGVKSLLAPLLTILIITLLCNVLNNIRSNKISGVSEVVYLVCFSIVVTILSVIIAGLIKEARSGILSLQKQINVVFPILLTVMTSMGGVVSVKAYTPMIAFLSDVISNVFVYVLFPLFTLSLILSIIGNLSDNIKLTKLNGFISSVFKWVVGTLFAVFMGFMSIKGILAGSSDGLSIKATKYAIKNYIPMLGGYISDGFELVKAGSLIVKNATGFVSIILLFSTILLPLISIAVVELGLKLLAGIIEPIGDKRTSNLLYDISKALKYLVVIIVGVALMYFLTLFLIMCSVSNVV